MSITKELTDIVRHKLESMGYEFDVEPSNADESAAERSSPEKLVVELAKIKAESVAKGHDNAVILGADVVVHHNGKIIEKPKDDEDAMKVLKSLVGKSHYVYAGICAINTKTGEMKTRLVKMDTKLRDVPDDELNEYIKKGLYKGKAGGYNLDDPGFKPFVEEIDGEPFDMLKSDFGKGLGIILKEMGIEPKVKK